MKTSHGYNWPLAFVFALGITTVAQELPFRRLGTNLYDFGPVLASGTNRSPFIVYGKVLSVRGDTIAVARPLQNMFEVTSGSESLLLSPGEQLQWLYAAQLSQRNISTGEYLALSPQVRRFLVPKIEAVDLLGYPYNVAPGTVLCVAALPVAGPSGQIMRYAYGEPVRPPFSSFSSVYRVFPDRIIQQKPGPRATPR